MKPVRQVLEEQALVQHLGLIEPRSSRAYFPAYREASTSIDTFTMKSKCHREHPWVQERMKSFYKSEKTSKRESKGES